MSAFTTECASRILYALGQVAKERELSAVIVPFLHNAFMTCLKTLADSLLAHRQQHAYDDKEVEAVCRLLAKLLDGPESKEIISAELRVHCAEALSKILVQHPAHHEVQVNAQWALAQIVGVQQTLQVVKPLFSSSPLAISAFLWTATDTQDELDWDSQKILLEGAVETLANHQQPADIDVQRRCFDLIGRRLSADATLGSQSDEMARQILAAESVQALLQGMTYSFNGEPKAATQAAEALWKVCRGASEEPVCNPVAQSRLSLIENEQHIVFTVLQKHSKKSDDLQRYLIDLLAVVKGLPCLIKLLTCPASSENLQWCVLKAIEHLQAFQASDAALAVHGVLSKVGHTPRYDILQQAVKALAQLIEGIQAHTMTTVLDDRSDIAIAVRCGAEAVLEFVVQFQEGRHGRWPAKSARTLRAAAFVDATSREALAKSDKLRAAAMQRITGACERHDNNTYPELEGTFALALTLWGIDYALDILRQALAKQSELHRRARHELIQVMCRVLTSTQDELESSEAMSIIKVILETKERLAVIEEQSVRTFGPMAGVLGHAMAALEGDSALLQLDGAIETIQRAAEAQAFFLDCVQQEDNLGLTEEICWGVCAASSAAGGIQVQLLEKAGVVPRLEAVVETLVQRAYRNSHLKHRHYDETGALSEALEALARLRGGGFGPMLSLMQKCVNVQELQIAALRAITNIIDDGAIAQSPQEVQSLTETCHNALAHFGQDERLRTKAERILGLCSAITHAGC